MFLPRSDHQRQQTRERIVFTQTVKWPAVPGDTPDVLAKRSGLSRQEVEVTHTWAFFLGTHRWEGQGGLDQSGVLGYSLPSHPANLLKGFPPVFVSLPTMSDLKKDTG